MDNQVLDYEFPGRVEDPRVSYLETLVRQLQQKIRALEFGGKDLLRHSTVNPPPVHDSSSIFGPQEYYRVEFRTLAGGDIKYDPQTDAYHMIARHFGANTIGSSYAVTARAMEDSDPAVTLDHIYRSMTRTLADEYFRRKLRDSKVRK